MWGRHHQTFDFKWNHSTLKRPPNQGPGFTGLSQHFLSLKKIIILTVKLLNGSFNPNCNHFCFSYKRRMCQNGSTKHIDIAARLFGPKLKNPSENINTLHLNLCSKPYMLFLIIFSFLSPNNFFSGYVLTTPNLSKYFATPTTLSSQQYRKFSL